MIYSVISNSEKKQFPIMKISKLLNKRLEKAQGAWKKSKKLMMKGRLFGIKEHHPLTLRHVTLETNDTCCVFRT